MFKHITANYSDATSNSFDDNDDNWLLENGAMNVGEGYIVEGQGAAHPYDPANLATGLIQSVIFPGNINNGIKTVPVSLDLFNTTNGSGNAFNTNANLIGNPYPSAIDLVAFRTDNQNINKLQGDFYFWTHDTAINTTNPGPDSFNFTNDDYSMISIDVAGIVSAVASSNGNSNTDYDGITANGFAASGQGFFANVKSGADLTADPTLRFNNAMRVTGENNNFLRPSTVDRIWLNLTKNSSDIFRQIYIGFHNNATDNYADGQDAKRLPNANNTNFYSIIPLIDENMQSKT